MPEKEFYSKLKQGNISKDEEKTKVVVRKLWGTIGKENQLRVLDLTSLSRPSVERAYKTGRISAKLAVALAEVSDVEPGYFTGENEEPEAYSDELLEKFLKNHGYKEMPKPKRQTSRKNKTEAQEPAVNDAVDSEPQATNAVNPEAPDVGNPAEVDLKVIISSLDPDKRVASGKMTEEEAIQLINGLFLKAKFNDEAKKTTDYIKFILTI